MNVYVDTSAFLRVAFGESGALHELQQADRLVSSELLAVESRRTIDRLHRLGALTSEAAAERIDVVIEWLEAVDLVLLRAPILARAGEPLPLPLGTLDALHLATALVWRDRMDQPLVLATHDATLGLAARAFGLTVLGL